MGEQRNLLFFVAEDWYFYLHFLQFASAAAEDGWKVSLICNTGQKGDEFLQKIKDAGIRVFPVKLSRTGITPFSDFSVLFQLAQIIRTLKPDLIHAVALKPIFLCQIASFFQRIPLIAMITGLGYVFTSSNFKAMLVKPFVKMALRMAGMNQLCRFVFLNQEDSNWAAGNFFPDEKRLHVIPGTGVNMDRFRPVKRVRDESFCIAYIGRMLKDKGLIELAEAMKIIRQRRSDVILLLAGAPDSSNPASIPEDQLKQWENDGLCRYTGFVKDIEILYSKIDAVVLPSYREGLGMSILEAASAAIPSIATDVPGCRSAVLNEKTGLLVPAGNPKAIADAVLRLADDRDLLERLGLEAREFVKKNFSREIALEKMLELYNKASEKTQP